MSGQICFPPLPLLPLSGERDRTHYRGSKKLKRGGGLCVCVKQILVAHLAQLVDFNFLLCNLWLVQYVMYSNRCVSEEALVALFANIRINGQIFIYLQIYIVKYSYFDLQSLSPLFERTRCLSQVLLLEMQCHFGPFD